jgi:FixJ family two-component response regulator
LWNAALRETYSRSSDVADPARRPGTLLMTDLSRAGANGRVCHAASLIDRRGRCHVNEESESPIVLVVDDEPMVCSSVKRLLRAAGHRVQTHTNAERLSRSGRPAGPCCLILDVQMPALNGLEFKRSLERNGVRMPIIFITGVGNIPMGIQAMKDGAVDFLTKPFDSEELLRAVGRALEADTRLLELERERAKLRRRFESLTAREQEVCFAVTDGLLNKQVGAEFGVSEKTVKVHRARVMEKMEATSLAELVRMADAVRTDPGCAGSPVSA